MRFRAEMTAERPFGRGPYYQRLLFRSLILLSAAGSIVESTKPGGGASRHARHCSASSPIRVQDSAFARAGDVAGDTR